MTAKPLLGGSNPPVASKRITAIFSQSGAPQIALIAQRFNRSVPPVLFAAARQPRPVLSRGFPSVFASYVQWHRSEQHRPATIRAAEKKVRDAFGRWLEANAPDAYEDISLVTPFHIVAWTADMQARGNKDVTVRTKWVAVQGFFSWCEEWGLIEAFTSPFRTFRHPPKVEKVAKATPTPDDLERILALCPPSTFLGARRRAMVLMFATCGLRRSELAGIRLEDVDLGRGFIRVMGKGGKERHVSIKGPLYKALHRYLAHRRDTSPWLWVTPQGDRLQYHSIANDMGRLEQRAGVEIRDVCHAWRRFFAVESAKAGIPAQYIMQEAGWSSEAMLTRYTRSMAEAEAAAEAYRERRPFR